jgi:metacaspase-1
MAGKRLVVWVHGIGEHRTGYSKPWRTVFNEHLGLTDTDYIEVLWEPVMEGRPPGARGGGGPVRLDPGERVNELLIRRELEARLAQQAVVEAQPGARGLGRPREWNAVRRQVPRGLWDVITNPGESIGDFARYLASRRLRLAVKECFKLKLRPLIGENVAISVISHSWGTVVAHDALVDLASEAPDLRVANLFTLGSPLWLVRPFLDERGGRRPTSVGFWMNVHARGDLVGSWLKPGFKADRDYEVPSVGRDAHGSYFVKGNEAVQRDLLAARILRR